MVNLKIAGKVTQIMPIQEGTSQRGNAWKKQEFIVEYMSGNYPNSVAFTLFGERRIAENPVQIGQDVTVSFDIESREFNGRWYTNCNAWRIEQGDTTGNANTAGGTQLPPVNMDGPIGITNSTMNQADPTASMLGGSSDDLPF